jgi:hypothetical protein
MVMPDAKRIPVTGYKSKTYLLQIRILFNYDNKLLILMKIMGRLDSVPTVIHHPHLLSMSRYQNLSSMPTSGSFRGTAAV